jgi:hypothetical protein
VIRQEPVLFSLVEKARGAAMSSVNTLANLDRVRIALAKARSLPERFGSAQELTYTVYLRSTDGYPAVRLGEGSAVALTADQKWAIVQTPESPAQLRLLPTGVGEARALTNDSINHQWVRCFADGKHYLFSGDEPGHGVRLYVQDFSGGQPQSITPDGV